MSGFTLIEVLVALTIFAFSFTAIEVGFNAGSSDESRAAQNQECLAVADSLLNATSADLSGIGSTKSGKTADGFEWTVSVTPWQNETDQEKSLAGAYLIEVNVGKHRSEVTLSTLRAGPVLIAK